VQALNGVGSPKHPLYLPATLKPITFTAAEATGKDSVARRRGQSSGSPV
jgi:hypothetical protein